MQRKNKLEQEASDVHLKIPQEMKRNMAMVGEKGAASWLTVLPIAELRMTLLSTKGTLEMLSVSATTGIHLDYHHNVPVAIVLSFPS